MELCDFSRTTIVKFSKNESVTLSIIDRLCKELDCRIEDVVEIINEKEK